MTSSSISGRAGEAGTRWYHSHAMAMADLTRSTYSGEFGFLIVEPAA
jgi:FtsP/CotA-like multicopper oxidase with cupredoxin domain